MDDANGKLSNINLVIQPHPFNSPESAFLITELDNELSVMYPDWASLPHPGECIGLVHETLNPRPTVNSLAALDAKSEPDTAAATAGPSILEQAVEDDGEGLHFFVAFASTSTSTPASAPASGHQTDESNNDDDGNDGGESNHDKKKPRGEPVGCIALRLSPHFPSHHPPSAYAADRRPLVEAQIQEEQRSGITTAQLKRLYVVSPYRSRKVVDPSVATRLVEYAERYAREQMGVHRLVLETGIRQHAAVKLYERRGWTTRECFGDYVSSRIEVGGVSVCYELIL